MYKASPDAIALAIAVINLMKCDEKLSQTFDSDAEEEWERAASNLFAHVHKYNIVPNPEEGVKMRVKVF
jgi:hypothetical protein